MSDKPRRKFGQLHLSTAVLLMLAAGGAFYGNLSIQDKSIARDDRYYIVDHYGFGLPCPTFTTSRSPSCKVVCGRTNGSAYLLNPLINGGLLFAIAFLCESLIRRREGRKP
jgi:hypothetical protein